MTMPYADGPLISQPELTLPDLRQAVAAVAPSRLPEFFDDLKRAFVRAGDEDSVVPIRMFYRQWGVVVEIERHPETARRLHAAEQAISSAGLLEVARAETERLANEIAVRESTRSRKRPGVNCHRELISSCPPRQRLLRRAVSDQLSRDRVRRHNGPSGYGKQPARVPGSRLRTGRSTGRSDS